MDEIRLVGAVRADPSFRSPSLQFAQRLIAREVGSVNGRGPGPDGAALQTVCARVVDTLCNSLGEDGCDALLARALSRTEPHHPALRSIRRLSAGGIHLDGVAAAVDIHPAGEVTAAVEALLGAVVEVLGRLIGEDMAIRILDWETVSHNGDEAPAP